MASAADRVVELYNSGVRGQALTDRIRGERNLSQRDAETAVARARARGDLGIYKPLTEDADAARRMREAIGPGARRFIDELEHQGYRGDQLRQIAIASGLSPRDATTAIRRARSEGLIPAVNPGGRGGGRGGGGGGGGPASNPNPSTVQPTRDLSPVFASLGRQLDAVGLGSLYSINSRGEPAGWLWKQIQNGIDSVDELLIAIEDTAQYKKRFSVIEKQKKQAAQGRATHVMTPAEVLEYERRAAEIFSAAAIPAGFYNRPDDFEKYILDGISLTELDQRVTQAYDYISSSATEVRRAFERFYGVGRGNGALAAFVLDPDRTVSRLEDMAKSAYVAGMGQRFGIGLGRRRAERLADLPHTEAGIVQGFGSIAEQQSVFDEGIFERGDLSAEDEGIAAQFYGDSDAQLAIERRRRERQRNAQATTGGAVLTGEGLLGAGST